MKTLHESLSTSNQNQELYTTIEAVVTACIEISQRVTDAPISGALGAVDNTNVQGETQKKLDVITNDLLKDALAQCREVRAFTSEEEDDFVLANSHGEYIVHFDPLDGSSNSDINSLVGTIFSIYDAPKTESLTASDLLRPGHEQLAAGYVLYGPSTILCLTTGDGVCFYALDATTKQFLLYQEAVTIDAETSEFAINMSNQRHWAEPMQAYVTDLLAGKEGPRGKNFNMRWVAAMVGDVHRVLCRSGLFCYPWDQREPHKAGKLRLMYEANPMSFLVEQAGGQAWTDKERIMDIQPHDIHQRVPVILGSASEVNLCVEYHSR